MTPSDSDLPASITSSNIIRARLTLYVTKATVPADRNVQLVTSDWHEKTPTVPTPGFAGTVAIVPAAKVVARRFIVVDVTMAVIGWLNGSGDFGFAITSPTGNLALGSKEGPATGYPAMWRSKAVAASQGLKGRPQMIPERHLRR